MKNVVPNAGAPVVPPGRVIEILSRSPEIAKVIAADGVRTLGRRETLARELAALVKNAEGEYPRLQTDVDAAMALVRNADEALRQAKATVRKAFLSQQNAKLAFDAKHRELSNELMESASPAITVFIDEMQEERRKGRHHPIVLDRGSSKHPVTGARSFGVTSNAAKINARMLAAGAAIAAAEALRFQPDQADVTARLAELRATLPSVE